MLKTWKTISFESEEISSSMVFQPKLFMRNYMGHSGAARNFYWGAKNVGVWGSAPENFSLTTPSTLTINVINIS